MPVEVDGAIDGPAGEVETAVYFIVAEALANVRSTPVPRGRASEVARDNGRVCVEVADDGIGGAGIAADRPPRAGRPGPLRSTGRCRVESPPGRTRLLVEIPCES